MMTLVKWKARARLRWGFVSLRPYGLYQHFATRGHANWVTPANTPEPLNVLPGERPNSLPRATPA